MLPEVEKGLGMKVLLISLPLLLAFAISDGRAQPAKPTDTARAPVVLDVAAIRKQAAQMAEFRSLLADPDQNVRLLAMREAIRSGDVAQREMAIEAGLASNESAMMSVALSGMLTNIQQIVLEVVDKEGKPPAKGDASVVLSLASFEVNTGRVSGESGRGVWTGQMQGSVFAFSTKDQYWRGSLVWSPENGDFRGRINTTGGSDNGNFAVIWKVR